jgi:hypothetical protein
VANQSLYADQNDDVNPPYHDPFSLGMNFERDIKNIFSLYSKNCQNDRTYAYNNSKKLETSILTDADLLFEGFPFLIDRTNYELNLASGEKFGRLLMLKLSIPGEGLTDTQINEHLREGKVLLEIKSKLGLHIKDKILLLKEENREKVEKYFTGLKQEFEEQYRQLVIKDNTGNTQKKFKAILEEIYAEFGCIKLIFKMLKLFYLSNQIEEDGISTYMVVVDGKEIELYEKVLSKKFVKQIVRSMTKGKNVLFVHFEKDLKGRMLLDKKLNVSYDIVQKAICRTCFLNVSGIFNNCFHFSEVCEECYHKKTSNKHKKRKIICGKCGESNNMIKTPY